ncbi:hypothetical protein GCM10025863_03760 [Microbacterium suwonense]|uniref:N-acetylmuramic acid 6-phosphate etherase n=1 Tax=Microbacterium suwonense TaxID=683047 RepID=A0ABN6WZ47_9MICO|nr:hypothetical protein GCM10025863_03760 [Microbacterium suwonense]
MRSRGSVAEEPFDADGIADRALRVDGSFPPLPDAPTTVIDLRRASSLAVDSAASHVAEALAAGGEVVRLDAEGAADAEIAAAGAPSIVLVDRLDPDAAQRTVQERIRAELPGIVTVNVGLAVDAAEPVITASAASLLSARAARRALLRGAGGSDHDELRSTLATFATERVDPRFAELDRLDTRDQVRLMAEHGHRAVDAVAEASESIARAVDGIVERMRQGGRLIYLGAGSPGRIGVLDASEIPPTFGADPGLVVGVIAGGDRALRAAVENAEDDAEAGAAELAELEVGPLDSVVGISASGRTPYVIGALREARARGALAIGVAGNRSAQLSADADIAIEAEAAPEIVAGSTRLNSGTAQKLVLNMLSTLAMVKLGKVYGNLMVDVQSTNEKLRARAERIVITATGCTAETAARALAAADGSVKLAIGIVMTGSDAEAMRRALQAAHGDLRTALAAAGGEDAGA